MHFTIEQVLWAVLLAAHLLLLIVLIGRERTSRFRWFTAYIGLSAISLIANHLLHGKLTMVAFYWQNYTLLGLLAIVGLFMLGELAKQTFSNGKGPLIAKPNFYIGWGTILITLSAVAVWLWGRPWPSLQALTANPAQLRLYVVILIGMKGQLGVMILTVLAVIVMLIYGSRFGSGWRSHAQQIALGLSTSALAFLAVQAINDVLSHTLHPKSQAEYAHAVQLVTRLENGRIVVWIISLLWILYWTWRDEPDAQTAVPASAGPVLIEGSPDPQPLDEDSTNLQA
ncbi:MAG TPA: hypothetical protein VL346_02195 [Acidobacteriaceae bacterium]|nr:hypothetical protein [Acidobacteriaceae bacterium]